MICIGVDLGLTGAMAMMDHNRRQGIADLPVEDGQVKGRALLALIREWVPPGEPCVVAFEHVLGQSFSRHQRNNFAAGESLARVRGAVEAVCDIGGFKVHPVSVQKWKRAMNLWGAEDEDAGRQRALELFPAMRQVLARKKDHNRADALLIAYWAYGNLM